MDRKLASIQKIEGIKLIPDADKIEMARVLGWECVVEKGKYKSGDLVIYFEVDSLIPRVFWSEFLFKNTDKQEYRLRTMTFRGQISQGLIVPFSTLDEIHDENLKEEPVCFEQDIGTDVSVLLKIKKYEPVIPAVISGDAVGLLPSYIPKTDEMRIQSFPDVLKEIDGEEVYITTKLDGMSMTAYLFEDHLGVCSRNLELKENAQNTLWNIVKDYNLKEKLCSLTRYFAIQGEAVGPGIAKNHLGLKKHGWFVFSVFDIKEGKYLDYLPFIKFCRDLELPNVPVEEITVAKNWSVEQLLERAKGLYEGTTHQKEGIVIRPVREKYSQTLKGRMSFKAINNDYLLSNKQ
ncbi:MAG: RNA ligase (ATP) [Candidatus Altiarchaeales archaeon A3]|nr:MAG: RNA ligase (ATP) [Candidatus Altiarchaeales archaeon A3]